MDHQRWISEAEWLHITEEDPDVEENPDFEGDRVGQLSNASIFKIPDFVKDTKWEAYVPERVLLGPYHHGNKKLRAVDHYKETALRRMKANNADFANIAVNAILDKEGEIRDSYEENIDCDRICLARMLCLDGCFILKVLEDLDDSTFFASNVLKDILMLENQIPWIVLLELVRQHAPGQDARYIKRTLLKAMLRVSSGLLVSRRDDTVLLDWLESSTSEVHHLLGFVRKVIVNRPPGEANPGNQGEHRISIGRCIGRCLPREHRIYFARYMGRVLQGELPSSFERCMGRCLQMLQGKNNALNHDFESILPAVELKNAGIKFRPCDGGVAEINFDPHSSTIYLPPLAITYDTEVLFRNLIAFELGRQSELNYIISYVNLMDDLIDSKKDVALLKSMGILTNLLGSDQEVADLFNGLFKGVSVRIPNMFDEVRRDVNANYKNTIRVQLAELWRDHFSSPWKIIALAAAFAILCLTLIQTIYTVKK